MDPISNENETSPVQRLLIGAAALFVVVLTVIGAVLLAMQDVPDEPRVVEQISPTSPPAATNTPIPSEPTATQTSVVVLPSDTPETQPPDITEPTPTPTATATPTPTETTPTATSSPTDMPATIPATSTLPAAEPSPSPTATPLPPPPPPATPTPLPAGDCPPPASWVSYEVQVGDTLNSLASRTGTSVFDLQQANCLETFTIRPEETLFLPFIPPTPTATYTPAPTRTPGPTPTRTATPFEPRITNVIVRLDLDENEVVVFVTGENFRARERDFRAELVGVTTVRLRLGPALSSTSFEGRAPLDELAVGEYDLVVINPDGRLDTQENVFPPSDATPTPTPAPPEITRVSPSSGEILDDIRMTVQGRNFRPLEGGFRVELQLDDGSFTAELSVDQSVRPATSTSFDVLIFSGTLRAGLYDLLVTNPNGQTDIERSAYIAID